MMPVPQTTKPFQGLKRFGVSAKQALWRGSTNHQTLSGIETREGANHRIQGLVPQTTKPFQGLKPHGSIGCRRPS